MMVTSKSKPGESESYRILGPDISTASITQKVIKVAVNVNVRLAAVSYLIPSSFIIAYNNCTISLSLLFLVMQRRGSAAYTQSIYR